MRVFGDPELLYPRIHTFGKCRSCGRLIALRLNESGEIDFDDRSCPHCGVLLGAFQIELSHLFSLVHTSSITSANKIASLDIAFIPFVLTNLLIFFSGFPTWVKVTNLAFCLPVLLIGVRWLKQYYFAVRFTDPEYLEAVAAVKRFLILWLAAHVLCWSLLLIDPPFSLL